MTGENSLSHSVGLGGCLVLGIVMGMSERASERECVCEIKRGGGDSHRGPGKSQRVCFVVETERVKIRKRVPTLDPNKQIRNIAAEPWTGRCGHRGFRLFDFEEREFDSEECKKAKGKHKSSKRISSNQP